MDLPVRYLRFFFIDAAHFFLRLWHNTISLIEEDLAVSLMLRLLFVPLFHDSSFVGRIMSFIFRLGRVLFGYFAYILATVIILILALLWYLAPVFIFTFALKWLTPTVFGLSLILFILEVVLNPRRHVTQLKDATQLMQATKLKAADLTWPKLLTNPTVQDLLWRLELPEATFQELNLTVDDAAKAKTFELAQLLKPTYLQASHFFVSTLLLFPHINQLMEAHQLSTADLLWALNFQQKQHDSYEPVWLWSRNYRVRHLKGVNRGWLAAPTPALNNVSIDLTAQAAYSQVDEFVGRSAQVNQVLQDLASEHSSNVLLVGQPGTGKTTLAKFLASIIVGGDAPAVLATKRLVQLDLTKLMSGVSSQGDLADRVKNFFNEVSYFQNIIVFVDEIENLGLGDLASSYNLYALMEPYLESRQIQFLATTEPAAYDQIIERHSAFARVFQRVDLPPATVEETTQFLLDQAITIESHGKVKLSLIALRDIAKLSDRYIHERVLPDSAIQTLQTCLEQTPTPTITSTFVKEILEQQTHSPLIEVTESDSSQILNLATSIQAKFIGQTEAVTAIVNSLKRTAAKLGDEHRPIGSFLFVGPTGVGKTELAKLLAAEYFHQPDSFLRFDMSEYQNASSLDRLIGSPTEPGALTQAISHHPATLILLDEFEKADPKILTLFLQVLDDGRLTDYAGKTVNFQDTIIIATSNAASLTIAEGLQRGESLDQLKTQVRTELLQIFKPELINRFDDVIIFKPLTQPEIHEIVKLKLADLQRKLKAQGYDIDFAPELITILAQHGYDPVLGARPLTRLIQDTLESNLSTMILEHKLIPGEHLTLTEDMFRAS